MVLELPAKLAEAKADDTAILELLLAEADS
jgi:hypothetical protein